MTALPARISSIEALRGFAAIAVAVFHFSGKFSSEIPRVFHGYGWLGVDVFFVISGFVIPLSLHGQGYRLNYFPRFMLRRLVRLEPPYLASIALGIALWHLSTFAPGFQGVSPSYSMPQIASHLLYATPLLGYEWLSPVYWTLAYEFVFYIAVGLFFTSLNKRRIEWTVAAAAAVILTKYALAGRVDLQLLEFACGVLVMRFVVDPGSRINAVSWMLAACMLLGWFSGPIIGIVVLSTCLIIITSRTLECGRWAYAVGALSYSLYLTHVAIGGRVINYGSRFGAGAAYELALVFLALAVSIAFAALFNRLIEAPAIRASRRIVVVPTRVS